MKSSLVECYKLFLIIRCYFLKIKSLLVSVVNRPRSIYQYSNMAPRLSGQNCKFLKFLLSLSSQNGLGYKENNAKFRSPESLGAMLEYLYIERGLFQKEQFLMLPFHTAIISQSVNNIKSCFLSSANSASNCFLNSKSCNSSGKKIRPLVYYLCFKDFRAKYTLIESYFNSVHFCY